jgi:hypothetical protein
MKTKPVIIIIATLLIGFVLGMLASAQIRYHKMKPVRFFFSEEKFKEGFYGLIQPNDSQREKLDDLLAKYARKNADMQNDFRKKMDQLMQDLKNETDPILTKEQLDKIRLMEKKRMDMIRHRGRPPFDSARFQDRGGRPLHMNRRFTDHKPDSSALHNKEE